MTANWPRAAGSGWRSRSASAATWRRRASGGGEVWENGSSRTTANWPRAVGSGEWVAGQIGVGSDLATEGFRRRGGVGARVTARDGELVACSGEWVVEQISVGGDLATEGFRRRGGTRFGEAMEGVGRDRRRRRWRGKGATTMVRRRRGAMGDTARADEGGEIGAIHGNHEIDGAIARRSRVDVGRSAEGEGSKLHTIWTVGL
ncbi:hypothetical protein OsJ_06544 [Oryza sativa Japonica Group]|jgi:hypothetical protein|uniref:Uncharacterized protein n=2 Tax=Oryza TaxID=4527 RepID=A3A6C1_ORYSJ|nr:hypothetical protein OsJ_06544 [Oryza sativa Japonica Group]